MTKLRILWICHFTNAEVQNMIPVWKTKNEFASWIPNMLKGFESRSDIELHLISPHDYLQKESTILLRNIHYHFVPYGIPFFHRHWPGFFRYDIMSEFSSFRHKVKKIVKAVDPDIINLIGAENAYYSSAILDYIEHKNVMIGIQGFISQFKDIENKDGELRKRIEVEESILKSFKYFFGEQDSSTYISSYNPGHRFFRMYFPVNEELAFTIREKEKKYDCIYYGSLTKIKGTEDFIKVVAELKKIKAGIKACIAGFGDYEPFRQQAKQLNCHENIEFVGFLKTQKELFECVKAARVFLVPPAKERLSSTIREAMYLKVPIVAYATGGIPYINEFDENIYMVETGDYKAMAEKTLLLLTDDARRLALAEKAYQYALSEYSLQVNTDRFLAAYQEILKN